MKSKDKQIRKLKHNFKFALIGFVMMSILAITAASLSDYYESKSERLESQLQSCQEKVPVWTFTYFCVQDFELGHEEKVITYTFGNYEDYKSSLDYIESYENCVVIK